MLTQGKYVFDNNSILEKAYDLLCILYANKEIARKCDPENSNSPLSALENRFFESKVSRLLIEIAAYIRVNDDQMKMLPKNNIDRKIYESLVKEVDSYEFGLFDELNLTFRNTCNKIIHTEIFELNFIDGHEAHEKDYPYWGGYDEKSIKWRHFSGLIRLSGNYQKGKWFVLLQVEDFIKAIYKVFS